MDGILNIDKPSGQTSFSLVAMVKRLTGERHVGHAGTLDPLASGVLPVCLGQGTRVVEFLQDATKTYRAQIELGIVTDTYDAAGSIIRRGDPSGISREQLTAALTPFCGLIRQIPPMYSAVKHQGKPLYQLARAGVTVERKSRLAQIHRLELVDWQPCSPSLLDSGRRAPLATIEVTCGKGTYIRSLAYDLGQALGCGAYLKNLIRLRYGLFDIKDAISPPQLEEAYRYGYWQQFIHPIDSVLLHWAALVVSDDDQQNIRQGRPLVLERGAVTENRCRAYALDGHFIAVLRFNTEKGQWQPEKVFSRPDAGW